MTPTTTSTASLRAVLPVAAGTFSIVTSEMLPVGLLTPIGSDLRISDGMAGLTMTVPGLVAAVSAPIISVAAGRLDRRTVLCLLMGLLAAANAATALAPNFPILLGARVLVGVAIGGFWAFAIGLAPRLVAEQDVPRGTAIISGGISVASVLGVPAGAVLADVADWRTAFAVVAVLAAAVLVALRLLLPPLPAVGTFRPSGLPQVLRNTSIRTALTVTVLIVSGHFLAYTYVTPVLYEVTGVGPSLMSVLLLVYGVAGVVGNFVGGSMAGRHGPRAVLLVLATSLASATLLTALIGGYAAIPLLVLWGLAYGGVSVSLQLWVIRSGPGVAEPGSALLSSVFNLSISLGALAGGGAVDAISTISVMWIGGALAVAAALVVWRAASGRRPA
ncbi:MFS transporter [Nonomuraea sp. NPDC046570]|uniref:MFS transporter n=1 Tax=Nonomuraea sp. NPDC046570 TaxID=3155255 RepID=UPI0033C336E8